MSVLLHGWGWRVCAHGCASSAPAKNPCQTHVTDTQVCAIACGSAFAADSGWLCNLRMAQASQTAPKQPLCYQ